MLMPNPTRFFVLAIVAVMMMAFAAAPVGAQPRQEGLVNVNVSGVDVQVPVAIAAAICDVNVNVLARQISPGDTACEVTADSEAENPGERTQNPRQEGLVNVNISDVTVQVPVSVAAAVCGVNVNVLAEQLNTGDVECESDAVSVAR
jgi:hypothetical protein